MAESIKVNVVSAKAFINLVRGDPESITWCTLVQPIISKAAVQVVGRYRSKAGG